MRVSIALLILATSPVQAQRQASGPVWYTQSTLENLTAETVPDSLVLLAIGTAPQSLTVIFKIFAGHNLVFEDSWSSMAYFAYVGRIDTIPIRARAEIVRDELRHFFSRDRISTVDTVLSPTREDPRSTIAAYLDIGRRSPTYQRSPLADTTVSVEQMWADLKRRRPPTFRLFEGGEDSRWIAWSHRARRFVVTDACC